MRPFNKRPKSARAAPKFEREDAPLRLFGVHAVEAALNNPARRIKRLLATENAENRLADVIRRRAITVERASPRDLDNLLGPDTVHQGLLLEAEPLDEPEIEHLAERAAAGAPLIILDHVTDPHNVGAVLRSAAVFGASGLIMTRRHSPPMNGVLAKSASGALEVVPVCLVQNLARAMADLKAQRIRLIGLDGDAETLLEEQTLIGPVALVLGAEGKGLRDLTRDTCDAVVRIATDGPIDSLNVSNAAAVALHLAAMQRRSASK